MDSFFFLYMIFQDYFVKSAEECRHYQMYNYYRSLIFVIPFDNQIKMIQRFY